MKDKDCSPRLPYERIIRSFSHDASVSLASGKAGFCLFSFWLAKHENNNAYQKVAEGLLDEVISNASGIMAIDLLNGLAGIGLTIRYLIKTSYVKGNPNSIVSDLDDAIYKRLSYTTSLDHIQPLSAIQILYYLCLVTEDQKKGSESEWLYRELIISTVNQIYQKADALFFEEPLPYSATAYLLPQFLFVLSKIYQLNFYNYRIFKILEEISIKILSILPTLHANRLFLMWGMDSVAQHVSIKGWDRHIELLKERLDINATLDDELRSRNIYIDNGVSGIYLLLCALQKYFTAIEMKQWTGKIITKIESSDVWTIIEQDPEYFLQHRGLLSGLCGVSMVLTDAKSKYSSI